MPSKGEKTREHVLATAESLILKRGFVGTSIDDILRDAGITKGGFFYHFDGKQDLAKQLMRRYLEQDAAIFRSLIARAETLSEDPLQRFLIFLKLLAETMEDLPETHPGCLVASFVYESHQFDEELTKLNAEGVLNWRHIFLELLEPAADKYPLAIDVTLDNLADMLTTVIEGGIVVAKVLDQPAVLPAQILLYRSYVRCVFGDL